MNLQTISSGPVRPFAITHRMVAGLAAPMTLAYLTTPLLGLTDTAVVGRLDDAALIGGLAVGSIIVDLIFASFNFQRAGTTGLTAQAHGAGDEAAKQAILARALIIAAFAGAALIVLAPVIMAIGLWAMAPGDAVAEATGTYFTIRMLAAPLALANYALLGWLIGLGRAGLGLALQILLNGLNIGLSIWLGLGLEWGIAGVAWATVIAEGVAMLAGLALCYQLADLRYRPSWTRIRDIAAIRRLVQLNGDIILRSFLLMGAFAFFTSQGARAGETTLAANAILMHLFLISGYFLDGMATAAEQIVGRAIGANYRAGFKRGMRMTMQWNSLLAIVLTLVFLMGGETLINLLTTLESVRVEAMGYLLLAALTPLTGVLAFQMDGVFIGATWSREMSRMMVVSFLLYLVAWWFLQPFGNMGLWLALHVFLIARGVLLALRVRPMLAKTFLS